MWNGRHASWLLVLVPACFHPSYDRPMCSPQGECPSGWTCNANLVCEHAPMDGAPGAPDALPDAASGTQFGTFIKVTFTSASDIPTMPLMWTSDVDLDTDASTMCNTRNNQAAKYCVVAATTITLASAATLRAHGSKPLVLLATSTFDLQGTIDVSSKHDGSPAGAGAAVVASCPNTTAPTGNSGGFGGSFGGKGGNGGPVDGAMGTASPALTVFPTDLRGGCRGGNGSSTTAGTSPAGGSGGGAVAIIADDLHLNGKINASGAAGKGGPAIKSGGGGGGSGGMIVLDARSIIPGTSPNIWLFANGGGGGQGGTGAGIGIGAGDDGTDPIDPTMAVAGGNNTNRSGGAGGTGSYGTVKKDGTDAGDPVNSGGGGAGGGGAGFIRTLPIASAIIAPAATTP